MLTRPAASLWDQDHPFPSHFGINIITSKEGSMVLSVNPMVLVVLGRSWRAWWWSWSIIPMVLVVLGGRAGGPGR